MMKRTCGYAEAIMWKSATFAGWNSTGMSNSATASSTSRVGSLVQLQAP